LTDAPDNLPTQPPARLAMHAWLPAVALTVLLWTVPNVIAFTRGGLKAPPGQNDFSLHSITFLVICFAWYRLFASRAARHWRRWAAGLAFAVSLGVGMVDEAIQALPFLPRDCQWEDFLADVIGAALAAGIAWEAARITRRIALKTGLK
jgi:VanZ family protein